MKGKKRWIISISVAWVILFVITLFTAGDDVSIWQRLLYTLILAPIAALLYWIEISSKHTSKADVSKAKAPTNPLIGLISCRQCGYLGSGASGCCPKCGSSRSDKITARTQLISCKNCGYMGAGSGVCPICGKSRVEKLTNATPIISCKNCGYIGSGVSNYCPKCGSTRASRVK